MSTGNSEIVQDWWTKETRTKNENRINVRGRQGGGWGVEAINALQSSYHKGVPSELNQRPLDARIPTGRTTAERLTLESRPFGNGEGHMPTGMVARMASDRGLLQPCMGLSFFDTNRRELREERIDTRWRSKLQRIDRGRSGI